jgi:hypothetical protein
MAVAQYISVTIGVRVGVWIVVLSTASCVLPLQGPYICLHPLSTTFTLNMATAV